MLYCALLKDDEVMDNEGHTYTVLDSTATDAVVKIITEIPTSIGNFFIFERCTGGVWRDREEPDFYLTEIL